MFTKKVIFTKMTDETLKTAIEMYQSGLTLRAVAENFDISYQRLHSLLKKRITMHPQVRFGDDSRFPPCNKADTRAHAKVRYALKSGKVKSRANAKLAIHRIPTKTHIAIWLGIMTTTTNP